MQVRQILEKWPELILVAAPELIEGRTMWTWSPLHLALHLVTPEAEEADRTVQVVMTLVGINYILIWIGTPKPCLPRFSLVTGTFCFV